MYTARARIIFLLFVAALHTIVVSRAECAESARGGLSVNGGVIGIRHHYTKEAFGISGFGYFHEYWGVEAVALVSASLLLSLDIKYRHSLLSGDRVYITLGAGASLDIDERFGYGMNLKTGMEFWPASILFFAVDFGFYYMSYSEYFYGTHTRPGYALTAGAGIKIW